MKKENVLLIFLVVIIGLSCSSDDSDMTPDVSKTEDIIGEWSTKEYIIYENYVNHSQGLKEEGTTHFKSGEIILNFKKSGAISVNYFDAIFESNWITIWNEDTTENTETITLDTDPEKGFWVMTEENKVQISRVFDLGDEKVIFDITDFSENKMILRGREVFEDKTSIQEYIYEITLTR